MPINESYWTGRAPAVSQAGKVKCCCRRHRKSPAFCRACPVLKSENQPCLLNYLLCSCPNNFWCACATAREPETHDISSCRANCSDDNRASCTEFRTSYPAASDSYSPCYHLLLVSFLQETDFTGVICKKCKSRFPAWESVLSPASLPPLSAGLSAEQQGQLGIQTR